MFTSSTTARDTDQNSRTRAGRKNANMTLTTELQQQSRDGVLQTNQRRIPS